MKQPTALLSLALKNLLQNVILSNQFSHLVRKATLPQFQMAFEIILKSICQKKIFDFQNILLPVLQQVCLVQMNNYLKIYFFHSSKNLVSICKKSQYWRSSSLLQIIQFSSSLLSESMRTCSKHLRKIAEFPPNIVNSVSYVTLSDLFISVFYYYCYCFHI